MSAVYFSGDKTRRVRLDTCPARPWSVGRKLVSAVRSAVRIVQTGGEKVRAEVLAHRMATCQACQHWNPEGWGGTGACRLCSCSKAKLDFAAMECPVSKWDAVLKPRRPARVNDPADLIVRHYRGKTRLPLKPLPPLAGMALTNDQLGLGDTIIMSDVAWRSHMEQGSGVEVWSASKHVWALQHANPFIGSARVYPYAEVWKLYSRHDCGNGHLLQRLGRAFGLPLEVKPTPKLFWKTAKVQNRVILHFEPGRHAQSQRVNIHPKARMLYGDSQRVIEAFVRSRPHWEFIQIGSRQGVKIAGAQCAFGRPLEDIIPLVSSAQWFLGIISGPMHLATAMGLKCVVIINFPPADQVFLPTLRVVGQVEEEWFYPQNVHLHQEGDGPLVRKLSLDTLRAAFDGGVYPFWRDDWLGIIADSEWI